VRLVDDDAHHAPRVAPAQPHIVLEHLRAARARAGADGRMGGKGSRRRGGAAGWGAVGRVVAAAAAVAAVVAVAAALTAALNMHRSTSVGATHRAKRATCANQSTLRP
jgi:hypothetical protein